ncbi:alanine/glycine:cation symporter family protein [Lacrimispora sp. 210928-DFI.3.58]|uniref:alanine/glycine:cation symporter family protein n=1 Tax=Lacrimispora sp. 210928-DFI.3.58 TaxID=2883214 RepID=UPI001D09602A|nr:alanine/glycine:cation symporter family protein [Lacrimispora sp. 210928-DFI.3.58]MCB7319765.1 alanine:cation symporter family protein [Lacrimispora sp. 210928-DFI.3.58]
MIGVIQTVYQFLWGDLITVPLPGGSSAGLSLLVLILIPSGIYFTLRTRFLPFRLFPEMLRVVTERQESARRDSISGIQALIVSTATRVGMGNLVGVVAAISAGGAGAVFWMWAIALLGSSTAFAEATLAQLYKERDPLYGGWRGGPAYYIHHFFVKKGDNRRYSVVAVLFALSGLLCWCGISQVIGNSVSSAFQNAFHIPPIYTTIVLVLVAAVIVLRKNATVKVLDVIVPFMAGIYFLLTIFIIVKNAGQLPGVFARIFSEAFGLRQAVAGGFGAVLMNGAKRGLFSNEAGSGSAPCAAAAADVSHPAKAGLLQAVGVFIDTIVICSCSAMIMLLAPEDMLSGLEGMDLLQTAMEFHFGSFGTVFVAVILWLFSFSTFIGILFYARSNVAYLFGDNWVSQTVYKILDLVMLFIGGLAAYTFVWDLGDIGVGLMTIFNMIALIPMSGEAVAALREYEENMK